MTEPRYTVREVERITGVTEAKLRALVRKGVIRKVAQRKARGQFCWQTLVALYNNGCADMRAEFDEAGNVTEFWPKLRGAALSYPVCVNRNRCGGSPTIAGTRIPTATLAGRFRAGDSVKELLCDYPIKRSQLEAALLFEGLTPASFADKSGRFQPFL